jgi:tetratricopeptide (TPR) repeat protein
MRTYALLLSAALVLPTLAQVENADMLAGMSALRKADHATAERAFTAATAASPDDPRTWYYRAVNRQQSGDHSGALADLERSLTLDATDVHALLRRAESHIALGQHTQALPDLERILAIRPTGPAAEHALFLIGAQQVAREDRVSAKQTYDRLVSIAPLDAQAWCNRGLVLASMHMDAPALADLEKAVALDPTMSEAYVQLALVLFRMDRVQEACHALHSAHDLGDQSTEELILIHCDQAPQGW